MEIKQNIYEKLQSARVKFLNSNAKKSGKNKFANFNYFELADILPILNPIMNELKMTTVISYDIDKATIKIINVEDPTQIIEISTPLADAGTKGCTPIQNLGSQQTYIRRYLYLTAFDIVESDMLDNTLGNPELAKSVDDFKKDFDNAKTVEQFTAIKKDLEKSLKDKKEIKEVLDYATKKFNELVKE